MKKISITLSLGVTLLNGLFSGPIYATTLSENEQKLCALYSSFAKEYMSSRQYGVPFGDVFDVIHSDNENSKRNDAFTELLIEAYETPLFSTEKMKEQAITEFSNTHHVACLKSLYELKK